MTRVMILLAIMVCMIVASVQAASAGDPTGVWFNPKNTVKVRVYMCDDKICGKVVWLRNPIDKATGKPLTDKLNPDASLRNRAVWGLQVLIDMRPVGQDQWYGKVYDADQGRTHTVHLKLTGPATMRLQSCTFYYFCGGQTWTRTQQL